MIIREFSEQDIDEITALMKSLCSLKNQKFDEERWRGSLEKQMAQDSSSEVIVAFEKNTNQVIGMAYCSIRGSNNGSRFGYLSNLIVKEEKRRSGIGEMLLKNTINYFKRNHIESVRLALKTNLDKAARILFAKLGFEEILSVLELKL